MQENYNPEDDSPQCHERGDSYKSGAQGSLKRSIRQLNALKNKLLNQECELKTRPKYRGQSWGGAEAMVISADLETIAQFAHRVGKDAILSTVHAYAIGELYRQLMRITAEDYFTKFEMWGMATKVGSQAVESKPSISQIELMIVIVDEIIRVHEQWLMRFSA